MSLPMIVQPGEGRSVNTAIRDGEETSPSLAVKIGTSTCTFKVTGKDTHGHFGLFEFTLEPETEGASPHIHKQMTEIFYVLEGEVELLLNQDRTTAVAGTLMTVPENTPHGFSNPSSMRSKLLIMFCPADSREQYFEGLAELTKDGRVPSQEELLELTQKFDQYRA